MSKVFSDEQIVKAISVCLQHHKDCNECPLVDVDNCTILRKYALDLINRLKKEIERLYNIKLDLEHQLTQKGLTEYVGVDVIEAEIRKQTAKEILQQIANLEFGYCLIAWDVIAKVSDKLLELEEQFGVEVE